MSSDDDGSTRKKFTLSKNRTKQLFGFLTNSLKTDELKSLRNDYAPKFDLKHFDLKRPKLDRQVKRRLKRVRSYDATRAAAKEKNLANIQFKVVDVFRPLLYAWALICSGEASEEHPLQAVVVCAMKLLGHCFNYLSGQRRFNILKITDPEYEDVANDPDLFNKKEFSQLFGKSFLRNLAKEVAVDNEMEKAMGRPGSSTYSSSRNRKKTCKRNGDRAGFSFSSGGGNFKKDTSGTNRGGRRSVPSICLNSAKSTTYIGIPFGGRISHFLNFWRLITADAWVLAAVKSGVSIPFLSLPSSGFCHRNLVFGESTRVCDDEVTSLLEKGAIEEISESEANFVSGVFVIPKSNGGFRMIINLKPINKFIKHIHFKMENLSILRDLVQRGDYFTKIDLTDAYLSVPLRNSDRKYVQFSWNGKFFQFRTLCFGLSIAPWAFTKLLKPIIGHLRRLGLRFIVYLDDILIINGTKEGAESDFRLVKHILECAGFMINMAKSLNFGAQSIEFLGTRPDSSSMKLTLKEGKLLQIRQLCNSAIDSQVISLRALAKILGNLSWAIQAVPYAQSHFRGLQALFINFYHVHGNPLEFLVPLDATPVADLSWWRENAVQCAGRSLEELKPDLVIYSDASLDGWGAVMNGAYASGPWTLDNVGKHINELEILAAFYALQAFAFRSSNITIHLMLDNASSVAYINKCGGTHSIALNRVAVKIIRWCEKRGLTLQAFHLPGKENFLADFHSRFRADSSDWKLDPVVFSRLRQIWPASVDLFASIWNRQLDCFVSWKHQPNCLALDAFSLNWRDIRGYLFPPFNLISRCLSKIRRDGALVTLVTPFWPTQPWFPLAVELACDEPRLIHQSEMLLTGPRGEPHPL